MYIIYIYIHTYINIYEYIYIYILVLSRSIDFYPQNLDNGLFCIIPIYPISRKYGPCHDICFDFAVSTCGHAGWFPSRKFSSVHPKV